jgi:acyl-CoA synthetase (AMP-forming)/AMP-acid ligase II
MFQLSDILERAVWLFADRPGVRQGSITLTYAELGDRVFRLAGAMQRRGLKPGDRVAILGRNSFRNLEVHLACAHAGLVLVPLNVRLAASEIDRILQLTQTSLLFQALPYEAGHVPSIVWNDDDAPAADNAYERLLRSGPVISAQQRKAGSIAEIYFTSGTTGEPKGACLTDQNLIASALDAIMTLELSADSVWFHAPPMFHLVDAFSIWALTLVGGCHVTEHFEPSKFCAVVQDMGVSVVSLPPTLLDMIARSPRFASYDLSSLNRISYGGAPMPEPIYRRCAAAFGCPLVQSYGTTETSGTVCQQMPRDVVDGPWQNSIGQPLPHIKIKVLNDNGESLAAGEVGELAIGGPRVMAGYWENPAATKAAFRDGFYLTGDLGSYDSKGHFTILGRKKEMIISGGENVYPAEVEKVLLSHPEVLEAAVFGAPHALWGEEVRAVVVLSSNGHVTAQALIEHCRTYIGGYKIPKAIEFSAEALPKTGPGKIAKAIIRAKYLETLHHAAT